MANVARFIERTVVEFFLASSDFNGIPFGALVRKTGDEAVVRSAVQRLVSNRRIDCTFERLSANPHIKRFHDIDPPKQVGLLQTENIDGICVYPSAALVQESTDVSQYNDRPFTKRLLLGEAQLEWVGFDLAVLERYFRDPRYHCSFHDYDGMISIGTEADRSSDFPERDKVLLESFGLGYDENRRRYAVAFLRYLANLSPEHQQYWNSFAYPHRVKLSKEYYRNSYLDEFAEYGSFFGAILAEIDLINHLTKAFFDQPLFLTSFDENRPPGLTLFLRPTLKNFNEFILSLDKVLSDNLNLSFFKGAVPLEKEITRGDGKIVVERKGTLTLLEEWLGSKVRWDDPDGARDTIIKPLRRVRQLRQRPAHAIEEDRYSPQFEDDQHEIVRDVYVSLMHLRVLFSGHHDAPKISVPDYIAEGKIAFF